RVTRTVLTSAFVVGMCGAAQAGNSDYAEFDGTNPANKGGSGALCGTQTGGPSATGGASFTYHVSVSNFSTQTAVLRLTHSDGVDFERYQVPGGTSFSLTHEGGKNPTNKAVRFSIENNGALAGQASVTGANVFCLSCDADANGAAACNALIPAGAIGPGPNS